MPTRILSSLPCSFRLSLALLAALLSGRATAAAPQDGPAPVMREHVEDQMPVLNGVPSCDDGDTAIDGSQGSCGAVNTPTIELGDYEDTGDPVALHNGMVSYRAVDLHIPGRGLDFTLTRRYSSKLAGGDGPLGFGWAHSYDVWIQIQGGQVILWNGNQRADVWEGDKTGGFTAPRGVFSTLTWSGATNTYTHRSRFGLKSVFQEVTVSGTTYGRLQSITDRDGNTLSFSYGVGLVPGGRSRLISVRDTMKRTISFSYNSGGRLTRVTDFAGREVNYAYSAGELISARTPKVLFACQEHLAPQGRIERYRYLSPAHLLTAIVRPNQGQSDPNAAAAVEFEYFQHPSNPNHWANGWCLRQRLGEHIPGVANAWITYDYAAEDVTTSLGDPTSPDVSRLRTRVTDRRGNVTEYLFNEYGQCVRVTEYENFWQPGAPTFVTQMAYDNTSGNSEGLLWSVQHPRGNRTRYEYYTGGSRWADGNVHRVIHEKHQAVVPQPAPTPTTRTIEYVWEPVYQHVCAITDERGFTRTYFCEWMEGATSDTQLITAVAAELGLTSGDALTLIGGGLANTDFNGDGRNATKASGTLVRLVEPNVNLQPSPFTTHPQSLLEGGASPALQEAVTTWTYNAYGQRTSMTDAEENVSVYLYWPESDPDGDGLNINALGDTLTGGYVRRMVEDTALPFTDPFNTPGQLVGVGVRAEASDIGRNSNTLPGPTHRTSDFRYTRFGYQRELVDPRGVKHEYRRNDLGEIYLILRSSSVADVAARHGGCDSGAAEDLTGQAYSYAERICHDFNGNVAERRLQNSGNEPDAGAVAGVLESNFAYDILDNLLSESHERDSSGGFETTSYLYDENENLERVIQPEGNDVRFAFDARDQLVTVTRGFGTPEAASETRTYDENGNVVSVVDSEFGALPTTFDYDEHDRLFRRLEPYFGLSQTNTTWLYDLSSNVTAVSTAGDTAGASPPQLLGPVDVLAQTEFHYDARSRPFRVDRRGRPNEVIVDGALIPGDNLVSTRLEYDRLGRRTFVVEDDGQAYAVRYDGAHRPIRSIDPLGNEVEICWDDNSNPVRITEREKYPGGGVRSFETYSVFDSLNRRVSITNELGETHRFAYDSRDNLVFTTDPQAALNGQTINGRPVNHPGNARRFRHDGLGRVIREEYDLYVGGQGGPAPVLDTSNPYNADGIVRLLRAYDLNGRLTSRTDDKGNATTYQYDSLDRLTRETLADSTYYQYWYSADSQLGAVLDPNGTSVAFTYDVRDRLTGVDVAAAGPSIVGTMKLRFEHDGLGRRTYARDSVDGALDANDWIVTRAYDGLGRVTRETQGELASFRTLLSTWREEAKRDQVSYPSGLVVNTTFDALDRVATINAGGNLAAAYTYAGPGRVLERLNGNGTSARFHDGTFNDSAHYDGARRPTRLEHVTGGGTLLTGFEHAYDRVGNRKFERRLHDGGKGDNYVYDSLYRLVTFERLVPAASVGTPGLPGASVVKDWKIDGVQNWRELITNGATTTTAVDAVNQYTAFGAAAPDHDLNGNLLTPDTGGAPAVALEYDFLNRLRRVTSASGGSIEHDYDAEGRRVRTRASAVASMPAVSEFVFDGWEEIEEHVKAASGSPFALARRYVHGRSLDEPVRLENLAFYPGPGTYWFQQSTLGNVAALADSSGAIVERYTYDAYGLPQFETPANLPKAVSASDFGNPYLFHARRFEPALYPLYDFRARFLDPTHGRFLQRDPPGTWHDALNLGGAMAFVADSPINLTDPMGRDVLTVALGAAASGGTLAKVAAGAAAVAGSPVALGVVTTAAVIAGGYYIYRRWFADPPTAEGGGGGGGGTTRATPSIPSAPSVPATPATPAAPAVPSSPGTPRLDPGVTLAFAQSGLAQIALLTTIGGLWGAAWTEALMSKRQPYQYNKPGRKKQGREGLNKGRQGPKWKPRKPLREPPKHTPGRDHRHHACVPSDGDLVEFLDDFDSEGGLGGLDGEGDA